MYTWIWRHLPGPVGVRIMTSVVLLLGVAALLLFVIFPAVEPHLPLNKVTVSH